jgi:lipopolysaccharide assembly protein A
MSSLPAPHNNAGSNRPGGPPAPAELPPQHMIKRTRTGGVWVASALSALVLVLLLIFILENGQRVNIGYFGFHGHLPLGVALLFAAALGVLLVVIPGTGRIVQLRITARRHRRIDAERATSAAAVSTQGPASSEADQP